jgi:FkbM family methyltransferase
MSSPESTPPATAALPDGSLVEVLNGYEASFVINEIFTEHAYPIDDLADASAPTIIDVGANIGIFVRYALSRCPDARVFAFEPAPQVFELLSKNTAAFATQVTAERCGISDTRGEAEFTYYPNYSLLSGFKAAASDDELLLRSGINSQLAANPRLAGRVTERHVAALAGGKLDGAVTIRCPLETLSHFIGLHGIQRVDFLKVDAERCELPILRGILADHWPLIQRVCMELHESSAADTTTTAEIQQILDDRGFEISLRPSASDYPRTLLLHARRPA